MTEEVLMKIHLIIPFTLLTQTNLLYSVVNTIYVPMVLRIEVTYLKHSVTLMTPYWNRTVENLENNIWDKNL